ncbi:hypothetical protein [Phytohabitans houttuyneae]|uniref:Uncharacterized protein n=1 Tax=Phytohabitans houttuyneae TaxID=1076126 RepID=A0A6V8K5D7_9ACTN|nr:hypothetical protein [Phytohabitans houttuyneae]GFJ77518.1 hypothetical protein Phou_016980 [Phytohabitans houttuyneae]
MAETDLLRASRDGDQFHYYWAARQCLGLLAPAASLVAVSIEGVSAREFPVGSRVVAGEQVVDIAEYYGSEEVSEADAVIYRQLKHSTVRETTPWTMSGLRRTLAEFGKRFNALKTADPAISSKISFRFVSNRLVGEKVLQTLEDLARGQAPRHADQMKLLRRYLALADDAAASEFARAFDLGRPERGLLALRSDFERGVADYLPGMRGDAPLRLKEIVAQRATSLGGDCTIRRADVLVSLGVTEDQLLPAPSRLTAVGNRLDRRQFRDIADQIIATDSAVVVHAVGGVGKSVLAGSLEQYLPEGSACITYDCFGGGGYRRMSEPRHEHRQALLQIVNELAGRRLCQPLIPASTAAAADYTAAFLDRVERSAAALGAANPGALLIIAVDAADNAVTAARDHNSESFVPDLLAEKRLPGNVRLVMFARTERVGTLDPPPGVARVELTGFSLAETGAYLHAKFADATDADVAEFHRRTFGNPRVQAQALEDADRVEDCLRLLAASAAADAAGALDAVIAQAVERVRYDRVLSTEEVDLICEALAALRPRVPVQVMADLCRLPAQVVHSFVSDLGRPLLIDGESVQFRDEPTETWFRRNHRPTGQALASFLQRLRPLADRYAYAAASLPQLLWEAEQFAELVQLAVDGAALPTQNDLERAEIEQQRIQFALKSAMKRNMKPEVARLALKAGSLSVGHSRRLTLIKENTHLAGELLDGQTLDDLVARRAFSGDWPGSGLGYEGCMLSFVPEELDLARSRLRSAVDWMVGWSRLPAEAKENHRLRDEDVAQVALGLVNTDGPEAAVSYLKGWTPATVAYRAGLIVAARLIEMDRIEQLNRLVVEAADNAFIQMAVLYHASRSDLTLGREAAGTVLTTLRRRRKAIDVSGGQREYGHEHDALYAAIAAVTAAAKHRLSESRALLRILKVYLPASLPHGLGDRFGSQPDVLLKAYALKAYWEGRDFIDRDLAHAELLKEMDKSRHQDSRELFDFQRNITPIVPWARIWARVACGDDDVEAELDRAAEKAYAQSVTDYQTPFAMLRLTAWLSAQILSRGCGAGLTARFNDWLRRVEQFVSWETLIDVVRRTAQAEHMDEVTFAVAARLDEAISQARSQASEKISAFTELAQAIRPASLDEARAFFGRAIDTADKIGDDVMPRWEAINALAQQASNAGEDAKRAYLTARTFEALAEYLGDAAFHPQCIQTVAKFTRSSALALAARWRSRRFGAGSRVLQALLEPDARLVADVPLGGVALLPLAETFDVRVVLEQALRGGDVEPARLFEVVSIYDRVTWHTIEYFEQVVALAHRASVDLSNTSYAQDRYQRRLYDPNRHASRHSYTSSWLTRKPEIEARREVELGALRTLDLSNPSDLETARRMCEERSRTLRLDDFIDAVLATPSRRLHRAIDNLRNNHHVDTYIYRSVLERLTTTEGLPRAAVDAARDLARYAVRRFCHKIAGAHRYEPLPLDLLSRATGQQPDVLYDLALAEWGARSDLLKSEDCFSLVYSLAPRLSAEHARDAFDQAIAELDYLNNADTADGPWDSTLIPPIDLSRCIAGYIWSALADPDESVRWRAAHAVHMLCRLGATTELQALAELATAASAGPFTDARMLFYEKHALLWLLMAIERASLDAPAELKPFETVLRQAALGVDTHVLLREAARRVLAILDRNNVVRLDDSERDRLARLNQPIGQVSGRAVRPSWSQRTGKRHDDEYWFYFDFKDHWIEPLAERFGPPLDELSRLVSEVITTSWALQLSDGRVEDQRRTRRILQDERTSYYKSEMPAVHDLDFYLSFHALMTVAGQLVDTMPVQMDTNGFDEHEDFTRWLQGFRPTRPDGRWLADRRDTVPADQVTLLDADYRDGTWTDEVRREDLLSRVFDVAPDAITVWEWSTQEHSGAKETVTIETALVAPDRAAHLMAAWQTSARSWSFKVPTADDEDDDLDVDGYRLIGWVEDHDLTSTLDERDPYASGVQFPGPRPSAQATQWLDIVGDPDQRVWSRDGETALISSVWSDMSDVSGRSSGSQGKRLSMSLDDLRRLTNVTTMSVIFKVTLRRRKRDAKENRLEPDEPGTQNADPHFKILVFDEQLGFIEL